MRSFGSLLMVAIAPLAFSVSAAQAQSDLPIPLRLAEPAVQHALKAYPEDAEKRREFIKGYVRAYLYSLRAGESFKNWTVESSVASDRGYACATKEIINKPSGRSLIEPEEFGYRVITLTGVYHFHMELSELEADDGAKYHVEWGGLEIPVKSGQKVKLVGWASPRWGIGFGHFSLLKQEIIVLTADAILP